MFMYILYNVMKKMWNKFSFMQDAASETFSLQE